MICIIDYELGNTVSVQNAVRKLGYDCKISRDENIISNSDAIILPGVGSFEKGTNNLKKYNLVNILNNEVIIKKKKILGICLGFQLMCNKGEEFGTNKGLSWLNLNVTKIKSKNFRLPHVGWNKLKIYRNDINFFKGVSDRDMFYFNHTYCIQSRNISDFITLAECEYGENFIAALKMNNIYGIQPHPEKSQNQGLQVLKNFFEN